jgi:hypothetical protein
MRRVTRIWKKMLVGAVCAAALGGIPADGHAQTVAAMAGHGWPNHFDGCFGSSFATMFNNCGDTVGAQRLLIVPTQAYTYGWYNNVYARAGGNGSNGQTNCQAMGIFPDGSGASFSTIVSTSFSSAIQLLPLGSVWVPTSGTLHFECRLAQGGGRVVNVEI